MTGGVYALQSRFQLNRLVLLTAKSTFKYKFQYTLRGVLGEEM